MHSTPKSDDILYAIDNTHVLREPDRRIESFGSSKFKFIMITELMDSVGRIKVRRGEVESHKPQIIKPAAYSSIELDGFDDKTRELLDWLKDKGLEPVFFQYGFSFKRTNANEEIIQDSLESVKERVLSVVHNEDDPMLAVIEGIEDAWEVGLLKFSINMIQKSQEINQFDYKRNGLI